MKKVLVAVDGSDAAMHAAALALSLTKATGGSITLAYAVPPVFVPPELPFSAAPIMEEAVKAGEKVLREVRERLGSPDVALRCVTGAPAESLAELAQAEGFDLIVVGSKGRGPVSRVLVGSVTDRLVHISPKPVLVVR